MLHKSVFLMFVFLTGFQAFSQSKNPLIAKEISEQQAWVDSVYNAMSLKERIGQLFMVDVFSSDPKAKTDAIKSLIRNQHIGGVIFSKGGPVRQAKLNNEFQAASKVPLLVAMDAEWGLAMRLDSTYAFPWNMTLGAIKDNSIVEAVGRQIGLHNKRLGVHINFAPVVDINVNPENPIIGNRSFGEDRTNVTQKSIAFLKGMQSTGVLGSAKHFPGHGDTNQDSHKTLPTIPFSRKRLDSIEMYPYKPLIDAGIASIMVAHLNVPALESRKGYPTSISKKVVTGLLKDSLDFQGLIFTDALNMKGAANFKEPGDIDLEAFLAGNDILLISENVPKAAAKIEEAYKNGSITEARLSRSVKKILFAKFKVGLNAYQPVDTQNLYEDLNKPEDDVIYTKALAQALTVLKNDGAILPVKDLNDKKIAYVEIGDDSGKAFFEAMRKYADVTQVSGASAAELLQKLEKFNYVIIGFHRSNETPWKSFSFSAQDVATIEAIAAKKPTVLDVFVRPYALLQLKDLTQLEGVVLSYQNSRIAQQLSAQLIFGAISAEGKLPVSLNPHFRINTSYETGTLRRLKYGLPEEEQMDSQKLQGIDKLMREGLTDLMFPGAQVLVARHGKVIFEKAYGYHTYRKKQPVALDDVYDLASMTKILATLPVLMQQYDAGMLKLDDQLGDLLPVLKDTNKQNITVKEVLSHYGRLKPWIPFYTATFDESGKLSKNYYRTRPEDDFSIKIAEDLYLRNDYPDSIIKTIADSDLLSRRVYKYSDLSYFLFKKYLEDTLGSDLDTLTQRRYYEPLGANFMGYKPLSRLAKAKVVPSENDTYWRMQQVQGYVHDMGAAMEDNIGGHAGLFSNANDVAKMMQMYLQNGYYGGKRYFSENTMKAFNTCYYCDEGVRRGIGFDKPQLGTAGPTCGCVAKSSFGHSGFTGTFTWADPESEIIYVFLSNRTFPTAENRKLITSDLRTRIQQVIQEAIIL
ncbi:glycoside hydrolase family 3 N-terminal domain-containing protein [Leeuwenhoekiella sp. H156]|uniref:glycoside hydrolase family 3 N-terminal domain-containing protein n=1 Tax=Leeuwenhoekiella sp. H156 TaxID=3450128 RepID=UPI003FA4243E